MNAKKKKKLYYRPLLNTKRQYINSRWVPNFSWWLAIKVLFNFSLNKMVGLMDLISSGRSFHRVPHTHPFNGLCLGLPGWAGTRKVKPIWILLKQETVGGSGISWTICKSASHSRQITTPAPTTQFFTGRMPFQPPNQQLQITEGHPQSTTLIFNRYSKN